MIDIERVCLPWRRELTDEYGLSHHDRWVRSIFKSRIGVYGFYTYQTRPDCTNSWFAPLCSIHSLWSCDAAKKAIDDWLTEAGWYLILDEQEAERFTEKLMLLL